MGARYIPLRTIAVAAQVGSCAASLEDNELMLRNPPAAHSLRAKTIPFVGNNFPNRESRAAW